MLDFAEISYPCEAPENETELRKRVAQHLDKMITGIEDYAFRNRLSRASRPNRFASDFFDMMKTVLTDYLDCDLRSLDKNSLAYRVNWAHGIEGIKFSLTCKEKESRKIYSDSGKDAILFEAIHIALIMFANEAWFGKFMSGEYK